jgi:hypothetical protein
MAVRRLLPSSCRSRAARRSRKRARRASRNGCSGSPATRGSSSRSSGSKGRRGDDRDGFRVREEEAEPRFHADQGADQPPRPRLHSGQAAANRRMHVWHPDLPRRACYEWSPIHNHRFSFRSTVLVGSRSIAATMCIGTLRRPARGRTIACPMMVRAAPEGGRLSFVAGGAVVSRYARRTSTGPGRDLRNADRCSITRRRTPASVVTIMEKLVENQTFHASTLIERGYTLRPEPSIDSNWTAR